MDRTNRIVQIEAIERIVKGADDDNRKTDWRGIFLRHVNRQYLRKNEEQPLSSLYFSRFFSLFD